MDGSGSLLRERDEDWRADSNGAVVDLERLIGIAKRQWRVVALCAAASLIFGMTYVLTAVPLYTSSASVLIDRGSNALLEQLSNVASGILDDEGSVLSQVEVLKSEAIASAVVDKLDLTKNPEFLNGEGSALGAIKNTIKSALNVANIFVSASLTEADLAAQKQEAIEKLLSNVDVTRVGRTYVLDIAYTSPSPRLSAAISNAIGDAYLIDKLDTKYDATRRASSWLQDRIAELRQKALESDLSVQKFRTANGLVSTGTVLISDQQLSELNSALIVAQSDTAKAKARYDRIQQILDAGQNDAIVTDVLDSSISNELRKKYLEASKVEAEIANRLGPNHVQAVRLRGEMAEYKRLMFEELTRIAQSYKSEFDVAVAREKSLGDSVSQATSVSAVANETQVQLRELEREAETYKNLYQTFLQRYQEAVQQQSFPVTDARVLSRASAPKIASYPKKTIILGLFLVVGAAIGVGIGTFREFRDRFFRTGDQVRFELDTEFLGIAPQLAGNPLARDHELNEPRSRTIMKTNSVSDYVLEHPLSSFAETLRSAKIAADMALPSKRCKIIGIVSALPGEGKSTVAINFAELLANQGARTVLIDADLRNPGATRALARHAENGLLEAILEARPVQDLLMFNPKSNLAFLPAVVKHRVPHSSELLTSPSMLNVISAISSNVDYMILDLPPLGPVVDARAMSSVIDGFIYVVEWGATARRVVRQTLENEPRIREKCLGVILNKVDQEKMKMYRTYGSSEYYNSRYSQYYNEP